MLIYNSEEMNTRYMIKDEIIIEIHSLLSPEEMLVKLKAGEDITEDEASITAFALNDGRFITQAEYFNPIEQNRRTYNYNTILSDSELDYFDDLEVNHNSRRNPVFAAFEAKQFNRPLKGQNFTPIEITKEQLIANLYAALGIMPTIKDIPEKNITELKKMSANGDRLYWAFSNITNENRLPTREEIEFYESLNDYERKVINESGVHPKRLLDIAKTIKEKNPNKLLTKAEESLVKKNPNLTVDRIATLSNEPFLQSLNLTKTDLANFLPITFILYEDNKVDVTRAQNFLLSFHTEYKNIDTKLAELRQEYNSKSFETSEKEKEKLKRWLKEKEFEIFVKIMLSAGVLPFDIYTNNHTAEEYKQLTLMYYRRLFQLEFLPTFKVEGQDIYSFLEEDIEKFAKSKYEKPMSAIMKKAEDIFKELYKGHAPRVLREYMHSICNARGLSINNLTEKNIRDIASQFNQKNIQLIAKYNNPVLFALSERINFNEIRAEHIQALAIFIQPENMRKLFDKGFVEWYLANKNTNVSQLVELLSLQEKIKNFTVSSTAKDLILDITQSKGRADCVQMEQRYNYSFKDNEVAIRGKNIVAQDGKMKMYILPADDYRNFTVGYDTNCCQHYGSAGETCVYKLTSDPLSACMVIERDGKILAQSFVWVDEAQDTLVFDNVEFADDRKVGQFNSLFAAWCRAMPYKNIHVGTGYNQGMKSWGKNVTNAAHMPTTLNSGHCYTDYHAQSARALKTNGAMQIQEKSPVKVTSKPNEPTKWDVLLRPETSFLLNDYHSNINKRLEFARNFLNEQTPEVQMEAVKKSIFAIKYITNPTEEVQKYVINKNPENAILIKNPCLEVQQILIDKNPTYIRNIQSPSIEMMKKAVTHNGLLLGDLTNPPYEVQKIAVAQNGFAIRFINNPDEELQKIAVKSNPKVMSLFANPSVVVQNTAIDMDPSVISLLPNPSDELQMKAIKKNPYLINSIQNPCYSAVKKAIEMNGLLIRNFQFMYPHLREVALKQNGFAIRALKNITDDEYVTAIKQNGSVINLIMDQETKARITSLLTQPQKNENYIDLEI